MSLLTVCQNSVASLNFGGAPASIIGNNDALARQMLAILGEIVPALCSRHNWQALTEDQTITTVSGTESYALPTDFSRYIGETFWDATNYWPMRGSIDPQTWQAMKRGIVAATIRKRFRVKGSLVYIYPTPTAAESLVAEYITSKPILDNDGTTQKATFAEDADTFLLPEILLQLELKWRLLEAKGLDYAEAMNFSEREIEKAIAHDTPSATINLGRDTTPGPYLPNIPQSI